MRTSRLDAAVTGRLALDAVVAALFFVLVGLPAAAVGRLVERLGWLPGMPWWRWACLPPLALVFLIGLLATAGAIRLLLPRLMAGRYPFPSHPHAVVWLLHFSLQRLMYLPVWRHFLFAFSTLRWALLSALGAKAAFNMDTSSDVLILDLPLMDLGAGSMIGAGCTISGHVVEQGTLVLGAVRIGPGAQVGNNVLIGPGTTIGEHATIGPECRLPADNTIGPFAYLGAACYVSPGVSIGANAVLGHQVAIGPGVTIGDHAVVATGTRIPKGTIVASGMHYPPDARDGDA
jgi:acetyltransferase-like isoleucine patch superfamily enzyme